MHGMLVGFLRDCGATCTLGHCSCVGDVFSSSTLVVANSILGRGMMGRKRPVDGRTMGCAHRAGDRFVGELGRVFTKGRCVGLHFTSGRMHGSKMKNRVCNVRVGRSCFSSDCNSANCLFLVISLGGPGRPIVRMHA